MHGLDDEIHAAIDADCVVEGKEVVTETVSKCDCYVRCDDATYCSWNSNGAKFGEVVLIFVEAEEVGVGEELSCVGWDFALIDEVEECVYVCRCLAR